MKKTFVTLVCFCFGALSATPQEFVANLKQAALLTLQTEPLLQTINQSKIAECITALCDTGYVELNNDPNHSVADITLGVMEKTFATMISQNQLEIANASYMHALPDLAFRFGNGYTQNLSSLVLTPEKLIAMQLRSAAVESLLSLSQVWGYIYYSGDDYAAFQADPANKKQVQNFESALARHVQLRADKGNSPPPESIEGVVYKLRMGGIFFTFTTNITDQTSEAPAKQKLYFLFPYKNPLASPSKQAEAAMLSNNIQYFFP